MSDRTILVIIGTNRPGSSTSKVARLLCGHYEQAGANVSPLNLSDLPREVFEPTAYASKPPAMVALQQRVLEASGLHIVMPEYNGSFPGVLKYFIDMLKFPESFERKPVAFVGLSAGLWGALRAVEQLQMIFAYRNAYLYPERVFLPGINQKLDADGRFIDTELDQRLQRQAVGFRQFVSRITA